MEFNLALQSAATDRSALRHRFSRVGARRQPVAIAQPEPAV